MQHNNNNQANLNQHNSHQAAVFKQKQEDFLSLCYALFKLSREGREWLAIMKESFIDKMPVADLEKDERHAYYREGQNSIIRSMYANIEAYEKVMKDNAVAHNQQ